MTFYSLSLNLDFKLSAIVLQDGCREFNGGAPLHIAATNLCLDVAKLLVRHGASLTAKDGTGKIPQGIFGVHLETF